MPLYNNSPSWVFSSAAFTIGRVEKKKEKTKKGMPILLEGNRIKKLKHPPSPHPLLQFLEGQSGLQQQKGAIIIRIQRL